MPNSYLSYSIPQACEELNQVDSTLNKESWEYILRPWAIPWQQLSIEASRSLLEAIPVVHNQLYSVPSWPGGLCNKACELLGIQLANNNLEVIAVNGLYSIEVPPRSSQEEIHRLIRGGKISEQALDYGNHSWLEVEGLLVDPTAGQFLGPRAWDGEFDDDNPWGLDCYFPASSCSGPFLDEWFDQAVWQENIKGHYVDGWNRPL